MSSRLIASAIVVAMLAGLLQPRAFAADDPVTTHLGDKVADIAFVNAEGKTTRLHELANKKAIVIAFLSFECPVSNSYMQPLSDMAAEMESHGVAFLGLTVNQEEAA